MPLEPGETFERYTIQEMIGRGGMGEVYCALDTRLLRKVALEVIRPDRASDWNEAIARLFREARAAAALTHPNAVAIFDLGEVDAGRPGMPGPSQRLRSRWPPGSEALSSAPCCSWRPRPRWR